MYYEHWRDVPKADWVWPNFSPQEIACRGTSALLIDKDALDKLQMLRDRLKKPIIVTSGYRSEQHNAAVGGAPQSKHLEGRAFDISMSNQNPHVFERVARSVGFTGFGFYPQPHRNFMHIDTGPEREWGERWPADEQQFSAEPPPPKPLSKSRTMKGGGAAGVATVGAGGVEVAQEALAETQTAVQPLVPYLDTLRWVFIAAALGGVAVAVYARWDDWRKGKR